MKNILLVLVGLLCIGLFMLIPDSQTIAQYPPPPTSIPQLPLVDYPIWIYYTCDDPVYVLIGWIDPPEGIPPFSFDVPGYIYVGYPGYAERYDLVYDGIDEFGKHVWHVYFPRPSQNWWMSALVREYEPPYNGWWVYPDTEPVICYSRDIYLPLLRK